MLPNFVEAHTVHIVMTTDGQQIVYCRDCPRMLVFDDKMRLVWSRIGNAFAMHSGGSLGITATIDPASDAGDDVDALPIPPRRTPSGGAPSSSAPGV